MTRDANGRKRARGRASVIVIAALLLVAAVGVAIFAGWPNKPPGPDAIAVVNGDTITWAALRRVQVEIADLQEQSGEPPLPAEELADIALQNLIDRQLLLQEALRRDFKISDDEFDEALSDLRAQFDDLEGLGEWMRRRDLTDKSLIEAIQEDMLVKRATQALMDDVTVTDDQISDYYEAQEDGVQISEEVRLRVIAVNSKEAAEKVLKALQEGANFSILARQVSIGARAAEGGDTGWVSAPTMPPSLREAVARLAVGEAAGPIEKNADEFLIVALADRRPVLANNLDEARSVIQARMLHEKRQGAVSEWLAKKQARSNIKLMQNRVDEST